MINCGNGLERFKQKGTVDDSSRYDSSVIQYDSSFKRHIGKEFKKLEEEVDRNKVWPPQTISSV